jgi:hypothetical protein
MLKNDDDERKKPAADETLLGSTGEDDSNDDEDPLSWVSKKIVSERTNDDGIRCISIIIIQLSGGSTLTDSNDAEVRVSTGGNELAISEVWCPLMADVRHFYVHNLSKAQG